jgi:quercetin 2,3-dioxygenase
MDILLQDKLTPVKSGEAREYRLVFDERIARGEEPAGAWQGLGNLVFLADTRLRAHGQTGLHEQRGIDVVYLLLEGHVRQEGSLQNGGLLAAWDVLIQRAGSEGFSHNAVNPDDTESRLIRMWVLQEQGDAQAACQIRQPPAGRVTRIYGGPAGGTDVLPARTCIDIARLSGGQSLDIDKPSRVYVCTGRGFANEETVAGGVLLGSDQLTFDAAEDSCLIIFHEEHA